MTRETLSKAIQTLLGLSLNQKSLNQSNGVGKLFDTERPNQDSYKNQSIVLDSIFRLNSHRPILLFEVLKCLLLLYHE